MTLKLKRHNGHWYVDGTVAGTRIRRSTNLPDSPTYKALAERERLRLESDAINGAFGGGKITTTFEQAGQDYVRWKRTEGKNTRLMEYELPKIYDSIGSIAISDLTSASLQVFAAGAWPGCKPGTIKRNMGIVRAVLNYAEKTHNGYKSPTIFMPRVNDARDMHFDETQANTFLSWVRDNFPNLDWHFTTLIDTGVRLNELCSLRTTSFDNDVVRVRKRISQTGKTVSRDIPLTADMKRVATEVKKTFGATEPVFRSLDGSVLRADHASKLLGRVLRDGCGAMGLPNSGEESMRPHDLRHTFAYLTAKAGADLGDLQYLMGHEDISQTMRYRGFIQSRARTYVANMRCV